MDDQKSEFYNILDEHIKTIHPSHQDTFCVTQEKYDKILASLAVPRGVKCDSGNNFKFWCNKLYKTDKTGDTPVLCCKKTSCPVITKEDMFGIILMCHEKVEHGGFKKTWDEITKNFAGIKCHAVTLFLRTCKRCMAKRPVKNQTQSEELGNSLDYLTFVQVHLVDCSSFPDGEYKWIMHIHDNSSKFNWAYPLKTNSATEVLERLTEQFCSFGPPGMLQFDSGWGFNDDVVNTIIKEWPSVVVINGEQEHKQLQVDTESGTSDLQLRLGKWMHENGDCWSKGLKYVVYGMNTSQTGATGKSPYQNVFGLQVPRSNCTLVQPQRQVEGLPLEQVIKDEVIDYEYDKESLGPVLEEDVKEELAQPDYISSLDSNLSELSGSSA